MTPYFCYVIAIYVLKSANMAIAVQERNMMLRTAIFRAQQKIVCDCNYNQIFPTITILTVQMLKY